MVLEDLLVGGYKIYQDDDLYKFTSDAIKLSEFAEVRRGDVVADFCSGSGIVGLDLFAKKEGIDSVYLFEMQKPLYEMSKKTIEVNGLEGKFFAYNLKVQDVGSEFNGKFSLVVVNPPYFPEGGGEEKQNEHLAICRSEKYLTLNDLFYSANRALKYGGRICLIHLASRLADVFSEMRKNGIEPKKIRAVAPSGGEIKLVLIEGVKGGKTGLKIMPELKC